MAPNVPYFKMTIGHLSEITQILTREEVALQC